MKASTARRLAIAVAAALLMAVAVWWVPFSRPDPAPTPPEAAVLAPAEPPLPTTTAPTETPQPTPTLPPVAKSDPATTPSPTPESDGDSAAAATSTPFTLADLAATSTPISALLPPALPSITVPPTATPAHTATPAAVADPPPSATPAGNATETAAAAPTPIPTPASNATPTVVAASPPTATPAAATSLPPPSLPTGPVVVVGSTVFSVDIASTGEEKRVGLSGREGLASTSGMLFLYETGRPYQFWMKGMLFAIDILWITPGCTVGDITHELQPPRSGAPDSEIPLATPSVEAAHVLEVVAGTSRRLGLEVGDSVRFLDISAPAGDSC